MADKKNTNNTLPEPEHPETELQPVEETAETATDHMREEIKQELKEELKQELVHELRRELVIDLGHEVTSTGRRLATGLRKIFFPTEKEILVKQLNRDEILKQWGAKFTEVQTLFEIEKQIQANIAEQTRKEELRLHFEIVHSYRFSRRKRMAASFVKNAIDRMPAIVENN